VYFDPTDWSLPFRLLTFQGPMFVCLKTARTHWKLLLEADVLGAALIKAERWQLPALRIEHPF
jgi:hypothetical protein